ncbi:MAG: GntR family transcriptional regulator [Gammaproteobacteria bacterium]|jgi:DNA-binding transcriptional regulator YhcF (GntR family)|nr:GntR family transcriptional regulator [Gammaproteobacteria bacterium]
MDFQNKKAIYLQIADYVCEQILLKKWQVGNKIPSIRELAISLEVNPNTVMRTYAFLEDKKIIQTQRGIGYFVAEDAYPQALSLKKTEFLQQDLPQIFRSMDLLGISFEALNELYHTRKTYEKE